MSIDGGFFRKERNAGNDTTQIRESEIRSNNPYDFSDVSSSYRNPKMSEQQYEEAILKLEYYNNHYEELTKDATVEQLQQLSYEIQKLKNQTIIYEAEQKAQEMRSRKF